jgi:hypothetical protein
VIDDWSQLQVDKQLLRVRVNNVGNVAHTSALSPAHGKLSRYMFPGISLTPVRS